MKTRILGWVVVAACALVAARAQAGYQEEKDAENLGVMERALAKVKEEPRHFDGRKIVDGADLADVKGWIEAGIREVNVAVKHYKQLSAAGKAADKAKTLAARTEKLSAYFNAAAAAYNTASKAAAEVAKKKADESAADQARYDALCKDLAADVKVDDQWTIMHYAIDIHARKTGGWWGEPGKVRQARAKLDAVAAACGQARYQDIGDHCADRGSRGHDTDLWFRYTLARWCAAAAAREALLAEAVANYLSHQAKIRGGDEPTKEWFAGQEGWLHSDQPLEYATYLYFTDKDKKESIKTYQPLFEAAGMKDDALADHPMWKLLAERKDKLRALVDELAPTWIVEGEACKGWACDKAKKGIGKWHKRAKVKKVVMRHGEWKVHTHEVTGIPLRRTHGGHVLYQRKGEPWCQLRSYTATEPYKGGGKYGKGEIQFGYVRFQKCD